MVAANIRNRVERACQLKILAMTAVGGGFTNQCHQLLMADGRKLFCKSAPHQADAFLLEAEGLKTLSTVVAVPKVLFVDDAILLLPWIESGNVTPQAFDVLGRALASLHKTSGLAFGWKHDNYIGATKQENNFAPMHDRTSWANFYFEKRLKPQLRLLADKGLVDQTFFREVAQLERQITEVLAYDDQPRLLHGDLWSGNFIFDEHLRPYFLDPAVYYGDPEADLALTRLFGGFAAEFYRGYETTHPPRDGWREREPFYQLYHLLNHVNMLGKAYLEPARRCLKRCAFPS